MRVTTKRGSLKPFRGLQIDTDLQGARQKGVERLRGVSVIDPTKYGNLLQKALPKTIETDDEFNAALGRLESIVHKGNPTPEESTLSTLLMTLIQEYDYRIDLPTSSPLETLRGLMEERHLRQADLLDIFGSRSVASTVLSGKRGLSLAMIRKLVDRFQVSADVLIR